MSFSFPYTLVGGTPENVNNVQSDLGAIKDEFNQVTTTGQLSVDAAASMSTYKDTSFAVEAIAFGALTAASYMFTTTPAAGLLSSPYTSTGSVLPTIYYFDPADLSAGGRSTKLRFRVWSLTNATAPGISITFGLYPITAVAGGATSITQTIGSLVTSSGVTLTTPASSTRSHGESADFDAPAAGWYTIIVTATGAQAANSGWSFGARLQYRQV